MNQPPLAQADQNFATELITQKTSWADADNSSFDAAGSWGNDCRPSSPSHPSSITAPDRPSSPEWQISQTKGQRRKNPAKIVNGIYYERQPAQAHIHHNSPPLNNAPVRRRVEYKVNAKIQCDHKECETEGTGQCVMVIRKSIPCTYEVETRNSCPHGDICFFGHNVDELQQKRLSRPQKRNLPHRNRSQHRLPTTIVTCAESDTPCMFEVQSKGSCRRGKSCLFSHNI